MDTMELYTQLQKKLTEKPAHLTPDAVKECHQSYIDYHLATKPDEIYIIPMEEMAELSQHLSKLVFFGRSPFSLYSGGIGCHATTSSSTALL